MDRRALTVAGGWRRLWRAQARPDVIVIGAGLAGLSAALNFQDDGARVAVLAGARSTRRSVEVGPHYRRLRGRHVVGPVTRGRDLLL